MSAKSGCLEQVVAGCLLFGLIWSILMLSPFPFLVGIGVALTLVGLADDGVRPRGDYAAGRTGRRLVNGQAPEVQLMWKNQDGLWVEALEQIYHVPFASYPSLAKASVAELCDVALMDGYYLYWPAPRQVVPLYALKGSQVPLPRVPSTDDCA